MQTYGGVEVELHTFSLSALDGDEWLASLSVPPKKKDQQRRERELPEPHSRSAHYDKENIPALPGIESR